MTTENPFKKRNRVVATPKPAVKDPAVALAQYGVHGSRQQESVIAPSSRRIHIVPIQTIRPGRYQMREQVNPGQFQQLKQQIQELGLNFVAVLCIDPDDENFYNPMMGGHLRIQAASELGITEVSAIIREYDRTLLAKGTYFENNGRQSLTLIEEGRVFKQVQDDEGWTQDEIAQRLLVPGGRSHVALCMLTIVAAPDLQDMLRKDPKRGHRVFYYLRQFDVLGEEKARELRAPLIRDFLAKKISTDEIQLLVKQKLAQEQGEGEEEVSFDEVRRQSKVKLAVKSFTRLEKEIGIAPLSPAVREDLTRMKASIDRLLIQS